LCCSPSHLRQEGGLANQSKIAKQDIGSDPVFGCLTVKSQRISSIDFRALALTQLASKLRSKVLDEFVAG
jgi:hypothetical protein